MRTPAGPRRVRHPGTGATGQITSVYVRDPDGNLVEVSTYDADTSQAEEP
jgi:catechol 2,3-dioxygenase-like lactoylglutathione lyase family enzyme